jgi:hypothetical protein
LPAASTRATAAASVWDGDTPLRLMLTTSTPGSAAISSRAAAMARAGRPPEAVIARHDFTRAFGATPVIPVASSLATMRLATVVPWLPTVEASAAQAPDASQDRVDRSRLVRSAIGATPLSTTATMLVEVPVRPAAWTAAASTPGRGPSCQQSAQASVWRT